jgi:Major Facilitator Superfamily
MTSGHSRAGRRRALAAFAAFGAFWGAWGALVPAVQAKASATDAELGVALLMVGLGALFSMRLTGALIDRRGGAVLPVVMALFGVAGFLPALATSPVALGAALLLVGITSGAADVAVNAAGVDEEIASGRPLMNLGHACFSAAVVASSLVTGALREAGAGPILILGIVLLVIVAVSLGPLRRGIAPHVPAPARAGWSWPPAVLLALGTLCAVAFVVENAWQTWSAVQLEKTLGAPAGLSSAAPAVFAGAAMSGRLAGNAIAARVANHVLLALGALVAALGSGIAALVAAPGLALVGVGLAGLGTSVCAPTLFSMAGAWAGPHERAAAVSIVTTVAYLGFLLGPPAVGLTAAATTLPTALFAIAVLALLLAGFAPLTARVRPATDSTDSADAADSAADPATETATDRGTDPATEPPA